MLTNLFAWLEGFCIFSLYYIPGILGKWNLPGITTIEFVCDFVTYDDSRTDNKRRQHYGQQAAYRYGTIYSNIDK